VLREETLAKFGGGVMRSSTFMRSLNLRRCHLALASSPDLDAVHIKSSLGDSEVVKMQANH
jgi:hypothetical protein